jgi:pimeloyl-ACP methyl ester carboxylesterase
MSDEPYRAAFTEGSVEADGFTLCYWEAGRGDPLLVLHGAGGVELTPAHALLAADRRLLALEMPGFGDVPNDRTTTLDEMAATADAFATALGLETYDLMGTSFGGAVALHLAVARPDRVRSLVLESPAQFRVGGVSPVALTPEQLLRAFRTHPEREPAFAPPDPSYLGRVMPMVGALLGEPDDEAFAARMRECEVRTLLLFGTDEGLFPVENARRYRQLLSNSSLIFVHDAAHQIAHDRPEAFADVVGDFLRRGMAFLVPDADTLVNP